VTNDVWALGAAYEPYVGRWSRLVAQRFVPWLGVTPRHSWLDVGCGTGNLTRTVLELADPSAVTGVDPSAGFLEYARAYTSDGRARFEAGDARDLPFESATFDAVVSGLVLNFVPDPPSAVAEMRRVCRPAATLAAYVWDYASGMQLIRSCWDAVLELDPDARDLDEGRRFPICEPIALRDAFASAGLERVEVEAIDVDTHFRDFDDYWTPFLGGQGPAPTYIAGLTDDRRAALRDRLRQTLDTVSDGSIALTARAWAVRGINS
jgi:SAM-dependent methyltransferase